jgi:predicted  nucleic acid-binding Zn-ribbon protein
MSEFNPYKNRDFYQKFVECNDTFNVNLENIKKLEKPVLLFGTSKAGKSTLVARLLSTSDRREFLDEIKSIQKTRENRRIEGIEIGGEKGSCTLIPNPLPLPDSGASKGLQMVDLPGFKDSDPMRDILISLFHKCTLSELLKSNKTPKIIVVIDARSLFNFPAFSNQYHMPLQEVFGDSSSGNGYSTFIDHMRFVFTHMDGFYAHNEYETGDQPSDIVQKALIDISNNASDINMVKLLGRMLTRRYHTCINYAEDDRDACIAKINALLADSKTESGLPPARMSIFETNVDKANSMIKSDLDGMIKLLEEEMLRKMPEIDKLRETLKDLTSDYNKIMDERKVLKEKIGVEKSTIKRYEREIELFQQTIIEKRKQIVVFEQSLEAVNQSNERLKTVLINCTLPHMIRFKCDEKTVMSGCHKIRISLAPDSAIDDSTVIMIGADQPFDLQKFHMDLKEGRIVRCLSSFDRSFNPRVRDLKVIPDATDNSRRIEATSNEAFDIIAVNIVKFRKDSIELSLMSGVFEDQKKQLLLTLTADKKDIDDLNANIASNKKALENSKKYLAAADMALTDLNSLFHTKSADLSALHQQVRSKCIHEAEHISRTYDDDVLKRSIQTVLQILHTHGLKIEDNTRLYARHQSLVQEYKKIYVSILNPVEQAVEYVAGILARTSSLN